MRFWAALFLVVACWNLVPGLARAGEGDRLVILRDAETEETLRRLATPVFKAAGIEPEAVKLIIVKDPSVNAFVAGGPNLFLHMGLLEATPTPEQLLGVIAHETGHMAGGHLARGSEALRNARIETIVGILAGLAAGVTTGHGEMLGAALGGAQTVATRSLLSFSRDQEGSADAAALTYLDAVGVSAKEFLAFMQTLKGQEDIPLDRQAPYLRTHPLTHERMDAVAAHLQRTKVSPDARLGPAFAARHARMEAKLRGYLHAERVLQETKDRPNLEVPALYARALALEQTGQLAPALSAVDRLLQKAPEDPYFHELRGQMLFEKGHVDESLSDYAAAAKALSRAALIRAAYGHALLESTTPNHLDRAISELTAASGLEGETPETWHLLAAAWGQKGAQTNDPVDRGQAAYALAEEANAEGRTQDAKRFLAQALRLLPEGSPTRLRAQDLHMDVNSASHTDE